MAEYSKHDIAKTLQKSVRTITYWADEKLIQPDIKPSRGKGKARVFSEKNLIEIAMVDVLSNFWKVPLPLVKTILDAIRDLVEQVKEFSDFYTNPDWGKKIEAFYLGRFGIVKVERGEDGYFETPELLKELINDDWHTVFSVIALGRVKNQALAKIEGKLELPPPDLPKAVLRNILKF